LICLGVLLLVAAGSSQMASGAMEQRTWEPAGLLDIFYSVFDLEACEALCLTDGDNSLFDDYEEDNNATRHCTAYTWYSPHENDFLSYTCALFVNTTATEACTNCHSRFLKGNLEKQERGSTLAPGHQLAGPSVENLTWSPASLKQTHFGVMSQEDCAELCVSNGARRDLSKSSLSGVRSSSYCSGYTWHGPSENQFYSRVCNLFANQVARIPCTNCHSVSLKARLLEGGTCDDTLRTGWSDETSAKACAQTCSKRSFCNYWTFNGPLDRRCYQFSACPEVKPCSVMTTSLDNITTYSTDGCSTGHKYFLAPTTDVHPTNQATEVCFSMIVEGWQIMRNCFNAHQRGLGEMRIEDKGSPLVFQYLEKTLLDGKIWPLECLSKPLCWTYDMRKDILTRHIRGSPSIVVEDREEPKMLTVGENLIMFGGLNQTNDWKPINSTVVYNTVSGRLTRNTLNPKWSAMPICALPVSPTEFITIEDSPYVPGSDCSKNMIKHNIFNNDTVQLPCIQRSQDGMDGPIRCAAEAGFLYFLGGRSGMLWQFNLNTQFTPSFLAWQSFRLESNRMKSFRSAMNLGLVAVDNGDVYAFHNYRGQMIMTRVRTAGVGRDSQAVSTVFDGYPFASITMVFKQP